jgi:hypothetical protein
MNETLSVDGTKIDQVLNEIAKLPIRLNKSSKRSKKDERLVKRITEIRDQIQDAIIKGRLKKSVARKD